MHNILSFILMGIALLIGLAFIVFISFLLILANAVKKEDKKDEY